MTESLIKKEDYRSITPYFCNRFLLYQGKSMPKKWWKENYFFVDGHPCDELEIIENINLFCTFKKFDYNTMTLGYPSKTDTARILKFKHAGIEIRQGNPAWGAEPNKIYFVVKHGEVVK